MRGIILAFAAVATLPCVAQAQWLNYPSPGVPRTADGKPNLAAPTPRAADGKPDLSGVWAPPCGIAGRDACFTQSLFFDLAKDLPVGTVQMTPWAAGIQKVRQARDHVDDPYGYCLPPGTPRINFGGAPLKIIQTPAVTALLYETLAQMTFRQVFTDGRPFPSSMEPTWLGYSIGTWEADDLVVSTTGFRDGGWLDTRIGRPHSDALKVTERFHRLDVGHMDLTVVIDDPKAFVAPWSVTAHLQLQPDTELVEMFCDAHDKTTSRRMLGAVPVEPPSPPLANTTR
jgi:hypothetical protein